MKFYKIFPVFLLFPFLSYSQKVDFGGVYSHSFEEEESYLEIIQNDNQISGELHDYRGVYYLHGSIENDRAKGLINLGNKANFFEMEIFGDHLQLFIIDMTEYGEPNYATQYDIMFLPNKDAKQPEKSLHNPFTNAGKEKSKQSNLVSAGRINAPYLGMQFDIPEGFNAENNMSDIILLPNEGFGFILIFRHDFDNSTALIEFLKRGYSDEEMNLIISEIKNRGDSTFSFKAKGYYEGVKVLAEGLSNLGPYENGVIMLYIMKEDAYLASAKSELDLIVNSMEFFPIKQHPLAQRWTYDLQGKSLKYGKGSSSDVVSSELLRTTAWINLCPNMNFKMVEPSGNGERKILEGKWDVQVLYGVPYLVLNSNKNTTQNYKLVHENGRLLMNKERWIVLKGFESECSE